MKKNKQLKILKNSDSFTEIKKQLDSLFKKKWVRNIFRLNVVLLIFLLTAVLGLWAKLPPQVPLFYSRPWGESQLVAKKWFLIVLLLFFIFLILNLRAASIFNKKEVLLAKIFLFTNLILCYLVTVTIFRIILIVI